MKTTKIIALRFRPKDRKAVYWFINGHWVHKGWLMPQIR